MVALQAVTAGAEVTDLMASLEADGEFAEQLFVHGLGVQTAEGMAEWVHGRVRSGFGIPSSQGRRYSWGYPSCPEQSELEKVFRLLDAPSIGLSLSGGFAVEPEQSTLAIVAHHPQAIYFGMRSGRLQPIERTAGDELIAGTERDPTLLSDLPDDGPDAVAAAAADEGERAGTRALLDLPCRLRLKFRVQSRRSGGSRGASSSQTIVTIRVAVLVELVVTDAQHFPVGALESLIASVVTPAPSLGAVVAAAVEFEVKFRLRPRPRARVATVGPLWRCSLHRVGRVAPRACAAARG